MAMVARLVPWSIVGLSLVVLGTAVLLNPYLAASPAALTGGGAAPAGGGNALTGLMLVGVGAVVALLTILRSETQR